jgi:hypothetical protein
LLQKVLDFIGMAQNELCRRRPGGLSHENAEAPIGTSKGLKGILIRTCGPAMSKP